MLVSHPMNELLSVGDLVAVQVAVVELVVAPAVAAAAVVAVALVVAAPAVTVEAAAVVEEGEGNFFRPLYNQF